MASKVDIINVGLTLLGEARIVSIDENTKPAREANAVWGSALESLTARYDWSFAMTRANLAALAGTPAFEFGVEYQLPVGCLRVVQIGETYVGLDMTDYRGASTQEFAIEGRKILTNMGAPLPVRYIQLVADTTIYPPTFRQALSCKIADMLAEALTQSESKKASAQAALKRAIADAVMTNAIERPPQKLADDEWIMARL
jgi:hypothetical protein